MDKSGIIGLLLTGGKSARMARNKSDIVYHKGSQKDHLLELMKTVVTTVYVSGKEDLREEFYISDQFEFDGPINGILSAMKRFPNKALLTLAVDLPLIQKSSLEKLIKERNPGKMATAYYSKKTNATEPLIAIWEPWAVDPLEDFVQEKKYGPKYFLRKHDIQLVMPTNDWELYNANTPEEMAFARSMIRKIK